MEKSTIELNEDPREFAIRNLVVGRSFVDIGAVWGEAKGEKVSFARRSGATSVAIVDVEPEGSDNWRAFQERMKVAGITDCRCIYGDITKIDIGRYDVVHSSGVLYHLPNPMEYLIRLRRIAQYAVVLTTAVIPEKIENEAGVLTVPKSGALFIPALADRELEILRVHWKDRPGIIGVTAPAKFDVNDTSPWWWLPSLDTLMSMCRVVGFKIYGRGEYYTPETWTLILE